LDLVCFKGYEDFIVQDIIVQPWTVLYRRERWQLPSGETVIAPLRAGTVGHFGAELKRFVISQYVQGQVTWAAGHAAPHRGPGYLRHRCVTSANRRLNHGTPQPSSHSVGANRTVP
jgi:hypothetical protein